MIVSALRLYAFKSHVPGFAMKNTGLKPWVRDAFELIKHAEGHAQGGSDFDRRMALISFDNAVELSIITYFSLHPEQRDGQKFKEKNLAQWGQGFHGKLKFFKHYVEQILRQPMQVELDVMTYYHRVRNELYHSGIGMVPTETDINGIRTAALWIFSTLFKVDVEPLLALDVVTGKSSTDDSQTIHERLTADEPRISDITEFLRLFISMRNDLNLLIETVGAKSSTTSTPQPELDEYRDVMRRAEELRNEILNDPNQEPGDARVKELSKELKYVHQLIEVRLLNHQREIAKQAIEATLRAAAQKVNRKAGIIWQSPGTGMTLSILSYVEQALSLEVLNDPLIIVASEINLIAAQTYHMLATMAGSAAHVIEIVDSSERLVEILKSRYKRVVFTTIQRLVTLKSQGPFNRNNLVFVGQDIHLSSGYMSDTLFKLLPAGVFIFFTSSGPPTMQMRAMFGDLIMKYDFRQAIEDNVVSPVDFEQVNIPTTYSSILEEFGEFAVHSETQEYARLLSQHLVSHFQARNEHVPSKALVITANLRFAEVLVSHISLLAQSDTQIAAISSAIPSLLREQLVYRFLDPHDNLKIAVISRAFKPIPSSTALKTIYLAGSFHRNDLVRVVGMLSSTHGERGLIVDYGKKSNRC